MLIKGLRVTPFAYYSSMMSTIMQAEKSYDSLPNFTAADCECVSFEPGVTLSCSLLPYLSLPPPSPQVCVSWG